MVTGAGAGIGRASALQFLREGISVAAVDRNRVKLEQLASDASSHSYDADLNIFVFDLCASVEETERLVERIESWRSVAGLVNCAGVSDVGGVQDTTLTSWGQIIDSNLGIPYRLSRILVPKMIESGSGVLLYMSSVAGLVGIPKRAAYCSAKAGLLGLTRSIAVDYAHLGIRANAICPGVVDTPRIAAMIAKEEKDETAARQRLAEQQLDGKMGSPQEVASLVVRLFDESFRGVNGSAIVVDGGLTAI
jgi:NAD(P)-dependent dehydrogenase (short-subunit alcohol dehydrogenase family)